MILYYQNKKLSEYSFQNEAEFEQVVVNNSKLFFGPCSIFINTKKKVEGKFLGGTIPDGLLFDFSDPENPEFYLVEVELVKHDFYKHIFPQLTKFFASFKNSQSRAELVEKIFSLISNDSLLKKSFKSLIGDQEIYKYIKDTIEKSQNVLLILDGDKDELSEVTETYSETWGAMVRLMILKEFRYKDEIIYSISPDFKDIQYIEAEVSVSPSVKSPKFYLTEEEKVGRTTKQAQEAYYKLKEEILKISNEITFNPQKYYLSVQFVRNIAFFKFSKSKFRIIVMLSAEETTKIVKHHKLNTLSESVQKFYNGPSCVIDVLDDLHIGELVEVFNTLVEKFSN